jgi:hypothetical protein
MKLSEELTNFLSEVNERIKADNGVECNTVNDILSYANKSESDKIESLLIKDLVANGATEEAAKDFYNEIYVDAIRRKNERIALDFDNNSAFQRFLANPHYTDTIYQSSVALRQSKHQCNRKPKPKKRGVKHGNRKKK